MGKTVTQYAASPKALEHDIIASPSVPDLAAVTAAYLEICTPHNEVQVWAVTITRPSGPSSLRLVHEFAANGSDVDFPGVYVVRPYVTTVGGTFRCDADELVVTAHHNES